MNSQQTIWAVDLLKLLLKQCQYFFSSASERMSARATQKKPCYKCDKGSGIFTCDGCQRSFCRKHSDEHRKELAAQMDIIGQQHDIILRDIDQKTDNHPLLVQIDTWEQKSMNKIREVANQARTDFNKLLHETKQTVKVKLNTLNHEIQTSTESESYTEVDLKTWLDQLNELRLDIEQAMNTYILNDEEKKSGIHFIKVSNSQQLHQLERTTAISYAGTLIDQCSPSVDLERFGMGDKEVTLSDNDLIATYFGPKLNRSGIRFGTNQYSKGKHLVRFRIEDKTSENFYFGIVTLSQIDSASIFTSATTVNGWWRCHYAVVFGEIQEPSSTIKLLEGDEMTLILDCDEREIYLYHHRTKRSLHLPVDIERCPYPWKVVVGLATVGNSLQILH